MEALAVLPFLYRMPNPALGFHPDTTLILPIVFVRNVAHDSICLLPRATASSYLTLDLSGQSQVIRPSLQLGVYHGRLDDDVRVLW